MTIMFGWKTKQMYKNYLSELMFWLGRVWRCKKCLSHIISCKAVPPYQKNTNYFCDTLSRLLKQFHFPEWLVLTCPNVLDEKEREQMIYALKLIFHQ